MVRWFARNDIATNFLMLAILIGGGLTAWFRLAVEVQPARVLPFVWVSVEFRGATPAEVERVIAKPIEDALEDVDGIEELRIDCWQGRARIRAFAEDGIDPRELRDEMKPKIDAIPSLRSNSAIEDPTYGIPNTANWREVITVAITGELPERELLAAARSTAEDLNTLPEISKATVVGARELEISIEVDREKLRSYDLTVDDINRAIRTTSVNVSAGRINTGKGSLMLRTNGQAFTREEFEAIPLRSNDGSQVRLGDVAKIDDGFEEDGKLVRFNGVRALLVEVMRGDGESAIEIADATKAYVERRNATLPDGLQLSVWDDESVPLRGRISTLGWSLLQGAVLVFIVLGLFLRPMVAFWVVIGIPISFAGGLLLMPYFGLTANMITIFAFIIVLGIVVDDAIVTGESIFSKLRAGHAPLDAAVLGAKEVATPVTFGILTTIVAFIPLLYIEGRIGHLAAQIPFVVGPVLLFSLVESKLILPAHLKHLKVGRKDLGPIARVQKSFTDGLEWAVSHLYQPVLDFTLRHRYITISVFVAIGFTALGIIQGGRLGFVDQPTVERYNIQARIRMQSDTPFERTAEVVDQLTAAANTMQEEFVDPETGQSLITNILQSVGGWPGWGQSDPEMGIVSIEILPPSQRSERGPRNQEIADRWRELVGEITGARQLRIRTEVAGRSRDDETESFEIELRGPDSEAKRAVTEELVALLRRYEGIVTAWSNQQKQREELRIKLRPEALELGLTQQELAGQVRSAFFGSQAQRIQRDSDAIRVMIRLPESERESLNTLDTLQINLRDGSTVPFLAVAELERGFAPSSIVRLDGKQVVDVFGQPESDEIDLIEIAEALRPQIDAIVGAHPSLSWKYDGYIAEYRENFLRTAVSIVGLMLTLYALLAIPFKSLIQPIFVLLAVPFGVVGALIGHMIMDITPSWLSIFGMLALAGVVVNDSLVMVDFINQRRKEGTPLFEAVSTVGASRFRPILLTSLTTFVGLLPLLSDTSIQAQFLIPMATSLAFGIVFATLITLFLIPVCYLIAEDAIAGSKSAIGWYRRPFRAGDAT